MKTQEYILRKIVKAANAKEAIELDNKTPVHEVFRKEDDSKERLESCIGFHHVYPEYD